MLNAWPGDLCVRICYLLYDGIRNKSSLNVALGARTSSPGSSWLILNLLHTYRTCTNAQIKTYKTAHGPGIPAIRLRVESKSSAAARPPEDLIESCTTFSPRGDFSVMRDTPPENRKCHSTTVLPCGLYVDIGEGRIDLS